MYLTISYVVINHFMYFKKIIIDILIVASDRLPLGFTNLYAITNSRIMINQWM